MAVNYCLNFFLNCDVSSESCFIKNGFYTVNIQRKLRIRAKLQELRG